MTNFRRGMVDADTFKHNRKGPSLDGKKEPIMIATEIALNIAQGQIRKNVRRFIKNERGATMTEYALVMVAVLVVAAGMFKALGSKVGAAVTSAGSQL
jgi:Flp pilus assembly pilin Flp